MIALAIWLGGLAAFWGAFVPALHAFYGTNSLTSQRLLQSVLARTGDWFEVCGVVMFAAQFLLRRRYQRDKALSIVDGVRQLLTFGALLVLELPRRTSSVPHLVGRPGLMELCSPA